MWWWEESVAIGVVGFWVAMETLAVGTSRLLGGATASSSASSSSARIFRSPGAVPAFGVRKGASVIRCQAQKNKKSPSSGGGFGAKTAAKPGK